MNSNEQYCQISTVRPISEKNHLKNATNVVPEKIARFFEVNNVSRFQHDRPVSDNSLRASLMILIYLFLDTQRSNG
jgi:hypothetical protein